MPLDRLARPLPRRRLRERRDPADPAQSAAAEGQRRSSASTGATGRGASRGAAADGMTELLGWLAAGKLNPHLSGRYPLARAADALVALGAVRSPASSSSSPKLDRDAESDRARGHALVRDPVVLVRRARFTRVRPLPQALVREIRRFRRAVREPLLATYEAAAAGGLDAWAERPLSALALVVMLDQFPRNLFRGSPRAFATDAESTRGRALARRARLRRGVMPAQRWFAYLPYEHAEDLAAQRESLAVYDRLRGDPSSASPIAYAMRHYAVIERFGRFPHRNAILGGVDARGAQPFSRRPAPPSEVRELLQARRDGHFRVQRPVHRALVRDLQQLRRCVKSSAPSSRITRSIRSTLPSRVSHSAQSAAWILSCLQLDRDPLERHPLQVGVEAHRHRRARAERGEQQVVGRRPESRPPTDTGSSARRTWRPAVDRAA